MKLLKEHGLLNYDLSIFGLGFESRSIALLNSDNTEETVKMAIGYTTNTDVLSYQANKKSFLEAGCQVFEGDDRQVFDRIDTLLHDLNITSPVNVQLDITVMSRHRLATILCDLIRRLPAGSIISIIYSRSCFVEPPCDSTPIRIIGELADELIGNVGDLSLPACTILGLGYEPNKALGVSNFLDSTAEFVYIPKSSEHRFENFVLQNNEDYLNQIPDSNIFNYNVEMPYSTYVDLKALIISLKNVSRPIFIPLGPKILSAIGAILGIELQIPIWRVSSDHEENPVERPASGDVIRFDLVL